MDCKINGSYYKYFEKYLPYILFLNYLRIQIYSIVDLLEQEDSIIWLEGIFILVYAYKPHELQYKMN